MLERLVAFALSQRLFVMLGVLLLIGAGLVMLPSLPIDAFPDVSPVQVKVIMKAPGLTPEEVEQRITVPIELELLGLPEQEDPSLHHEIRARGHHRRLRGWHRHLLGAQPGHRTPVQHRARPARGRERRAGADHEPARRNVHVHHRQSGSVARRAAQPARLGDPSRAANGSGRCRRQRAWRLRAGFRDRAAQRCACGTRHFLRPVSARDRRRTAATTALAASTRAKTARWCGSKAASVRSRTSGRSSSTPRTAFRSGSRTSPGCRWDR